MDRGSILSGAAFRGAVYGVLVFLCILVAGAILIFFSVRRTMMVDLQDQILGTRSLVIEMLETRDVETFLAAADEMARRMSPTQQVLGIFDRTGQPIVGNLTASPRGEGWSLLDDAIDTAGHDLGETVVLTSTLGPFTMVVGRGTQTLRLVERTLLVSLVALGAVMTATFVAIGYTLSRGAQHKLAEIEVTLDRVSRGDMGARVAIAHGNDQIDRVSRKVNLHLGRLSDLMRTTRATAAAIAHDLRTPLSRAYLASDRVLEKIEQGQDARPDAEDLHVELTGLGDIFDTILRISRIEAERGQGNLSQVDLRDVVDEVAEAFTPMAEDRGQHLTVTLPDRPVTAQGDATMLRQMLSNLLQNAISHTREGARIAVAAELHDGLPRLLVSDSGAGIPAEDRERVFDPFFRLDVSRSTPGTGLGLSLVRAVAERHGARITLGDNAPGLRVEIAFPAADAEILAQL